MACGWAHSGLNDEPLSLPPACSDNSNNKRTPTGGHQPLQGGMFFWVILANFLIFFGVETNHARLRRLNSPDHPEDDEEGGCPE